MKGNFTAMLKHAQLNKYAIPSFNFENLETLKAIIKGAENLNAPIIVMVTPNTIINYMDLNYVIAITNAAINTAKVPIILQLDHCLDPHFIKTKITSLFNLVMLDWSNYSTKENIEKTKEIVQFAAPLGIAVESEINYSNENVNDDFNIIDQAVLFRNKTNINALVISANNNSHIKDNKQNLKIDLIKDIANKMPEIFLVLNDNIAINNEQLTLAIAAGISKVNISTDLRSIYLQSLKDSFKLDAKLSDIKVLEDKAIETVQKFVEEKIMILGANNKVKF